MNKLYKCGRCNNAIGPILLTDAIEHYGWFISAYKITCPKCRRVGTGATMKIKIGETIEHGGQDFVVVDIKHHASMDGMALHILAYDPDMANKEQQKAIKIDQTNQNVIDMLKKLTEGGGLNLGGIGFGG